MLSTKLKEAAGNSADATLYVDDVFSTWLYTGTGGIFGSAQTITNGIDLAGKGGMVWIKQRTANGHAIFDTARGVNQRLDSANTAGNEAQTNALNSFGATGFFLGKDTNNIVNGLNDTYASWTFRKATKFFDVVTYTGTGSARTIAHSLGVAPGMVIVKRTDTAGDWQVYSNGLASAAHSIQLNLTNAQASAPTVWNSTAPTSSVFSVGTDATVNASGGTYVAYLFAHDTSSTGIIQCGSVTSDSSGNFNPVTLGWEPQYILLKGASTQTNWSILDTMRGWSMSSDYRLQANATNAEDTNSWGNPTATGFTLNNTGYGNNSTVIYMAIRRPNKPPTSGTQVYNGVLTTNDANWSVGFPADMIFEKWRSDTSDGVYNTNRLTKGRLRTNLTELEYANFGIFDKQNDMGVSGNYGNLGQSIITHNFKRAPGFFDVVCFTGTGANMTIPHNLTVAPELIIFKTRSVVNNWFVCLPITGADNYMVLNLTNSMGNGGGVILGNGSSYIAPTSSNIYLATPSAINSSGATVVAYLFATLAGISKVGSYTGNGSSQNIECGFAAGARFVLIKRTDSTGDWFVWDTARGIVAANDPHLSLNTTAAEVTTDDSIDPYSAGFTVNQVAATNINVSSATYIFLAIA